MDKQTKEKYEDRRELISKLESARAAARALQFEEGSQHTIETLQKLINYWRGRIPRPEEAVAADAPSGGFGSIIGPVGSGASPT